MSNGLFKVNSVNLALARAAVRAYGECWLHGDGNIYAKEEDSDFRAVFSNPNPDKTPSAGQYRLHLTSISQVPNSAEEAEDALMRAKAQEAREAQRQKSVSKVRTLSITEDDLHENDKADAELVNRVVPQKPVIGKGQQVLQTAAQVEANRAAAKATGAVTKASDLEPGKEDQQTGEGGFTVQDDEPTPAKNSPKSNVTKSATAGVTI